MEDWVDITPWITDVKVSSPTSPPEVRRTMRECDHEVLPERWDAVREGVCPMCDVEMERLDDHGRCPCCGVRLSVSGNVVSVHIKFDDVRSGLQTQYRQ